MEWIEETLLENISILFNFIISSSNNLRIRFYKCPVTLM
jgi:hypothetical protein